VVTKGVSDEESDCAPTLTDTAGKTIATTTKSAAERLFDAALDNITCAPLFDIALHRHGWRYQWGVEAHNYAFLDPFRGQTGSMVKFEQSLRL
jgi:hypothetical protein